MSRVLGYCCAWVWEKLDTTLEQKLACKHYAQDRLPLSDWSDYYYVDQNCKNRPLDKRQAGLMLIGAAEFGDHIVVASANRLALKPGEFFRLAANWWPDVTVHAVEEGFVSGAWCRSAEVVVGLKWGAKTSDSCAGIPIGYTKRNFEGIVNYLPNESERRSAEWLWKLYQDEGLSFDKIEVLLQRAYKEARLSERWRFTCPRNKKPWDCEMIRRWVHACRDGWPVGGKSEAERAAEEAERVRRNLKLHQEMR
jgi:hypothetical protein